MLPKSAANVCSQSVPTKPRTIRGYTRSVFPFYGSVKLEYEVVSRHCPEVLHVMCFACQKIDDRRRFNPVAHWLERSGKQDERDIMRMGVGSIPRAGPNS